MNNEKRIQDILENNPSKERRELLIKVLPQKYVDILLKNVDSIDRFYQNKINRNEKIYLSLAYEDAIISVMDKYWKDNNQEL